MAKIKSILRESVLRDSLPDDIVQSIIQNRTSLGNNPAVPDIFDVPYLLKATKSEFEKAKDKLKEIGSIDVDDTTLTGALAKLIERARSIEFQHRKDLEKLCFNYVVDIFNIPEDVVDIKLSLVDKVDTSEESILLEPFDGDEDLEFDDVDSAMQIKREVYKRRFLDAICMGTAMYISEYIFKNTETEISSISGELMPLYEAITSLNRYTLFEKEDLGMTDDNKLQVGTFVLRLGTVDEKCVIESQGVIFPFLLCETIRGFLELFISHGLPKDKEMAMSVLQKSDFLKAEPWDMRIGPHIWKMLSKSLNDIDFVDIPYLFKRISSLPTDKFNFLMKEVLAGTNKGRRLMSSVCKKAKDDSEYDKFVDKMDKMKRDKEIITDDYIHPEEL